MAKRRGDRWACLVFAALLLVAGSCAPGEDEPASLKFLGFRQDRMEEVCLNEPLVFYFSEELDRASVTAESVQIRGRGNQEIAGRFLVRERSLEFVPDLPRAHDLSDGGLQPGVDYVVRLLGFPSPDGLRARDGRPLSATFLSEFRTADAGESVPLFLNPFTSKLTFLAPERTRIGPFDAIVLACEEALDPTTVEASLFQFGRTTDSGDLEEIPLVATLLVNDRSGARLELRPTSSAAGQAVRIALPPDEYFLALRTPPDAPATLGNRLVPPSWSAGPQNWVIITVAAGSSFQESFADPRRRSPRAVEGVDGTAFWNWSGAAPHGVEMRVPAAAGDGRDGAVGEGWARPAPTGADFNVHAASLRVPAGEILDLSGVEGLVVLRSQGALEIAGTLRRSMARKATSVFEDLAEYEQRRGLTKMRSQLSSLPAAADASEDARRERIRLQTLIRELSALTSWLQHARETGEPWTVLVSGGDLRIPGRIDVDGPLVLVAGGWIRVSVAGRVEASEVWMTSDGGGDIRARPPGVEREDLDTILHLDPPVTNVLRRPLRLAVLSNPIRPPDRVERWGSANIQGDAGGGGFAVRYLGESGDGRQIFGSVDELDWHGAPVEAVRLRIELWMPAGRGEPWDPPRVDDVRISWK